MLWFKSIALRVIKITVIYKQITKHLDNICVIYYKYLINLIIIWIFRKETTCQIWSQANFYEFISAKKSNVSFGQPKLVP